MILIHPIVVSRGSKSI